MSRHASPRPGEPARRTVVTTIAVVVLAAVALLAVVVLGGPDGARTPPTAAPGATPGALPGAQSETGDTGDAGTTDPAPAGSTTPPVAGPQEVVAGPLVVRSEAWLRRGLAEATTFKVGTLNVLGNSHTADAGNRRTFASGTTRMGWAYSLITSADLDVVGFQELEEPQYARFRALGGSQWDAYPGPTLDRGSIRDSIAWRTDTWELVEARSIAIPYFGGQLIRRPVVLLRNRDSHREVWFFNTHNPADTPRWGNNARWRAAGVALETDLANELGADGTPVVFTGDYNDRAEVFCPMTGATELEAANGGSSDGGCVPPARMDVDWIFGSGLTWQGYVSASQGITGRVTDHPFVYAESYVPRDPLPPERAQIARISRKAVAQAAARAAARAARQAKAAKAAKQAQGSQEPQESQGAATSPAVAP